MRKVTELSINTKALLLQEKKVLSCVEPELDDIRPSSYWMRMADKYDIKGVSKLTGLQLF